MKAKTFMQIAAIVFTVVAGMHLLKLVLGFEMVVNGWSVPYYESIVGFIVAGYLAWQGFKLSK